MLASTATFHVHGTHINLQSYIGRFPRRFWGHLVRVVQARGLSDKLGDNCFDKPTHISLNLKLLSKVQNQTKLLFSEKEICYVISYLSKYKVYYNVKRQIIVYHKHLVIPYWFLILVTLVYSFPCKNRPMPASAATFYVHETHINDSYNITRDYFLVAEFFIRAILADITAPGVDGMHGNS